MGNWNIQIRGIGCHHNTDHDGDADRLIEQIAKLLVENHHTVLSSLITAGQGCVDWKIGESLTFGEALEALKSGCRVARQGWNGKGMFLFLLPAGFNIPTSVIHDPALRAVVESEIGGETFDALGSIRMFTADKKILTGWLASQTDMLSEDWVILQ